MHEEQPKGHSLNPTPHPTAFLLALGERKGNGFVFPRFLRLIWRVQLENTVCIHPWPKNNNSLTEKVAPSQALRFMPTRPRAVTEKVNTLPASNSAQQSSSHHSCAWLSNPQSHFFWSFLSTAELKAKGIAHITGRKERDKQIP